MNGKQSLDAPLFLQSDEDRLKAEIVERWERIRQDWRTSTLQNWTHVYADPQGIHSHTGPCAGEHADRSVAVPQNAKKQHSSLSDRQAAVLAVLADGRWHATPEFLGPNVGGSEGMRRLRELKTRGYLIERRKIKGRSSWEYRLRTEGR